MTTKAVFFVYGSTLLGVFLAWLFGGEMGAIAAGLLAVIILVAGHQMKDEGEEQFEENRLFGGPIPWAEQKIPERKPNLVWSAFQFVDATYDKKSGIWREQWGEYARKAFVIHFANLLHDDGRGVPAHSVRAQIIWVYDNGSPGPSFFPAAWIDEELGMIDIPVGYSKKLVIGIKSGFSGGYYWDGYSNPRMYAKDKHNLDGQMVPSHGTMMLKLIGATNEVWYEQKWKWEEDLQNGSHPHLTQLS